jgi:hypothetical protein
MQVLTHFAVVLHLPKNAIQGKSIKKQLLFLSSFFGYSKQSTQGAAEFKIPSPHCLAPTNL